MKVVAFNGSPRKQGNTYHAIKMVAEELEKEGIEVEIVHVGDKLIRGCLGCGACARNKDERCIIKEDDIVNESVQKIKEADGIILGSPVYFSGIAGTMKSFLDRVFYVSRNELLRHKVGASVVTVRRAGGVPTFNQLNNYINYAEMIMPSTSYWNVINGAAPGEVTQDEEGKQIMRVLGKNMAWLLKSLENSENKPEMESKIAMNFIR
ncbi:MAG: flavodoxin family protein [Proteocatella sp.]